MEFNFQSLIQILITWLSVYLYGFTIQNDIFSQEGWFWSEDLEVWLVIDIFGICQGNIGYDGYELVGLRNIHHRIVGFRAISALESIFGIYLGNLGSWWILARRACRHTFQNSCFRAISALESIFGIYLGNFGSWHSGSRVDIAKKPTSPNKSGKVFFHFTILL